MNYFSTFLSFILTLSVAITACHSTTEKQPSTFAESENDNWVTMLVEVPAGTIEKYELDKVTLELKQDSVDGMPRVINYLGYPGNYGMIPKTLLPLVKGGDGDPLDIISIGPPAERGELIECRIIGVLKLLDRGEQDDKLIAISRNSSLQNVNSITDLENNYPGILEIIEIWFKNYKGAAKMETQGYRSQREALEIYEMARQEYLKN